MNYRHDYHAGNFADVVKHVVLTRILVHLSAKPAPFRYIETHAGSGVYDLFGAAAEATGEWRNGIGRITAATFEPSVRELLAPYLAVEAPLLASESPRYKGSPAIAASLARPIDKLLFCELHPEARARLDAPTARDRRAKTVAIDGYIGLRAFVPPIERRGLVLIDPPFEDPNEFSRLAAALEAAWRKWRTGIFMAWYPVKDSAAASAFVAAVSRGSVERLLRLELQIDMPHPAGPLVRCGLLVVNPPFRLEEEARAFLPALAACLAIGCSGVTVDGLAPG